MKINEEAARCMLCASPKCSKACPKKLDPARMLRAVRYENSECAAEFIALGCKNVQVTTAVMQYGYRIIDDLVSGLKAYMKRKNIAELNALAGSALKSIVPPEELDRSTVTYPVFKRDKCIGCGRCYISCRDGGHQAICFDDAGKPALNGSKCVGCHLCSLICPVNAIGKSKRVLKK